jgi:hypothetical protein
LIYGIEDILSIDLTKTESKKDEYGQGQGANP